MLSKREVYHVLGVTYMDERNKPKLINRIARRLEQLGFQVNIETIQPTIA